MRLSYQFFQSLPRVSSLTARYGLGIVSSGVILFVCILLDKVVTGNVPLILLIIPVSVSAVLGGFGSGLLATALCGLASPYFLTQPHFTIRLMDTSDWERLALFLATSVLLCWLFETARMARQEVEARAREAVQRQRELREADRRKDEFLTTLAHELRNPLAPLRNAIQILGLRGDDPLVVGQTKEVLDRQVHQMIRLVEDLLEVSRIGRGKISLQKASIDLAEVVATAVETSRPLIEAHRHKLTVSLPRSPASVEGDAARLAQVISNLLNNAAKYTGDGGRIDLIVEQVKGLEEARAFHPDLVFLDLDLPEMDGYEVARRLRLEPAMKGVTLVAMTGYGQEEDRQRTQEAGFHLHLVKPIDFDKLEELLSLPADQIGRRAQSHTDPDSAERQSDTEADYMKRSVVAQDVITKFQSQSEAVLEPPIHASAEIDRVQSAVTEEQRISTGHEWSEFA